MFHVERQNHSRSLFHVEHFAVPLPKRRFLPRFDRNQLPPIIPCRCRPPNQRSLPLPAVDRQATPHASGNA